MNSNLWGKVNQAGSYLGNLFIIYFYNIIIL